MTLLLRSALFFLLFAGIAEWCRAQNTDALDADYGFFGVKLGDTLGRMPGMTRTGKYLKKDVYMRANQTMTAGSAELSRVEYLFYKERLHSIRIKTADDDNAQALLELLQAFYGEGKQDGMAPVYRWEGKRVRLKYEQNMLGKQAEVILESREIQNLFEQEWRLQGDF